MVDRGAKGRCITPRAGNRRRCPAENDKKKKQTLTIIKTKKEVE